MFSVCLIFLACSLFLVMTRSSWSFVLFSYCSFLIHSFSNFPILSFKSSISLFSCSSFLLVSLTMSSLLLISSMSWIAFQIPRSGLFRPRLARLRACCWKTPCVWPLFQDFSEWLWLLLMISEVSHFLCRFYSAHPWDSWSEYLKEYFVESWLVFLF